MAITLGTPVHNAGTTAALTVASVTVASTANRILVAMISLRSATATVSSVTWNTTENFSKATSTTQGGAPPTGAEIWYLVNPTATTASVVCNLTASAGQGVTACAIYGVEQAAPRVVGGASGTSNTANTPDLSNSVSTTIPSIVVDALMHESTSVSTVSGTTAFSAVDEGVWNTGSSYVIQGAAGSQTMGWNNGNNDNYSQAIAAFADVDQVPAGNPVKSLAALGVG